VLADNGGALAAAVTAASAAAADAGLPLRHTLGASLRVSLQPRLTPFAAGVCVAVTREGALRVHPSAAEEAEARAVLTFAFAAPGAGAPAAACEEEAEDVALSSLRGRCSVEEYVQALAAGRAAAVKLDARMRAEAVQA